MLAGGGLRLLLNVYVSMWIWFHKVLSRQWRAQEGGDRGQTLPLVGSKKLYYKRH